MMRTGAGAEFFFFIVRLVIHHRSRHHRRHLEDCNERKGCLWCSGMFRKKKIMCVASLFFLSRRKLSTSTGCIARRVLAHTHDNQFNSTYGGHIFPHPI
jgi:hypothetical protein